MSDRPPGDGGNCKNCPKSTTWINLIRCMACGARKKEDDIHDVRSRLCIECVKKQNGISGFGNKSQDLNKT